MDKKSAERLATYLDFAGLPVDPADQVLAERPQRLVRRQQPERYLMVRVWVRAEATRIAMSLTGKG